MTSFDRFLKGDERNLILAWILCVDDLSEFRGTMTANELFINN